MSARLTITSGDGGRTVTETTSAVVPTAQPVSVTVRSGRFTTVTISFDSGIR
ncbi:hypothetical protein [Streptomyces sp. NPDC001100]